MILTVKCEQCGKEFESEGMDRTEFCPHCGSETRVAGRTVAAPPPPLNAPRARMKPCADCGSQMSKRALWCPACGSIQRSLFGLVWEITGAMALVWLVIGVTLWLVGKLIERALG
jgi:DNA-directed RNA polymerase subunit RPC12/RpoP